MKFVLTATVLVVLLAGPAGAQSRDENWAFCESGDPDRGISACTTLIESGAETVENLAIAHSNRGITYSDKGQFEQAIADYERALQLRPGLTVALNSLAWDLATMPVVDRRDGRRAVEFAERALATSPDEPGFLDTAAAAYADAGRFADAVAAQERAIALLRQTGSSPDAALDDFNNRLRLYQAKRPFHRTR